MRMRSSGYHGSSYPRPHPQLEREKLVRLLDAVSIWRPVAVLTYTPYEDLYQRYVMHENNSSSHHFPAFACMLVVMSGFYALWFITNWQVVS